MGFLDNYEASRERLERWLKTYPDGRIETRIVEFNAEKGYVLVEARAYRDNGMIPAGIDFAYGYVAAYQKTMQRWFVEDTVTSAIMRVQQLVMGGAERSTKEIMEKVGQEAYDPWATKHGDVPSYKSATEAENAGTPSHGASEETQMPTCKHGDRVWKEGTKKNGDAWGGYMCPMPKGDDQCQPSWYIFGSNGMWRAQ